MLSNAKQSHVRPRIPYQVGVNCGYLWLYAEKWDISYFYGIHTNPRGFSSFMPLNLLIIIIVSFSHAFCGLKILCPLQLTDAAPHRVTTHIAL
jgi:hypothetical protein